jgi:predicted HTH transcriptional regulator
MKKYNSNGKKMYPKRLMEIIAGGESTTVEFKKKVNDPIKIAKEMTAFANTRGGTLIIGVEDNGKVCGIESEKYEIETLEYCANYLINPPIKIEIEIVNVKEKYLAVCYIEESTIKPHFLSYQENNEQVRQAYIRLGEKSTPAGREMTSVLKSLNKDAPPFTVNIGEREKRLFRYLEINERATASDFSKLVNISKRSARRILVNLVRAGVISVNCDPNNSDYFTLI